MYIFYNINGRTPGGAENLVFQIVRSLCVDYRENCLIVGDDSSYLVKRLHEDEIKFNYAKNFNWSLKDAIKPEDVLILFGNDDNSTASLKNLNCRIIVWNVLIMPIVSWNRFGFEKKLFRKSIFGKILTKKMLISLIERNGYVCMDGSTRNATTKFLKVSAHIPILPVPVDITDQYLPKRSGNISKVAISYIGRGDEIWKVKPIKKVILDIAKIKNINFNLYIYTNTSSLYEKELYEVISENVRVHYVLNIFGEDLRRSLNSLSDIHFSMGTSALEGALSGLPTVLLDASFDDFPDSYLYRWLSQTSDHSLGDFIVHCTEGFVGVSLKEIFTQCADKNVYHCRAKECFEYAINNHSAINVAKQLLEINSFATVRSVMRYTASTWLVAQFMRYCRKKFLQLRDFI